MGDEPQEEQKKNKSADPIPQDQILPKVQESSPLIKQSKSLITNDKKAFSIFQNEPKSASFMEQLNHNS
jgi:hypothetical protein